MKMQERMQLLEEGMKIYDDDDGGDAIGEIMMKKWFALIVKCVMAVLILHCQYQLLCGGGGGDDGDDDDCDDDETAHDDVTMTMIMRSYDDDGGDEMKTRMRKEDVKPIFYLWLLEILLTTEVGLASYDHPDAQLNLVEPYP